MFGQVRCRGKGWCQGFGCSAELLPDPGVGQAGLLLVVVAVEQGPDVGLLVLGLGVGGGHAVLVGLLSHLGTVSHGRLCDGVV